MTLLDDFLPEYGCVARYERLVAASPERVWQALLSLTPRDLPISLGLMALRSLPGLVPGRKGTVGRKPLIEEMKDMGFTELGRREHELALGTVGRFWELRSRPEAVDPETFRAFERPGSVRATIDFRAEPHAVGALFSTETRIQATDAAALRSFSRYWLLVRAGSGLIRLELLRAVERRAVRG